MAAVEPAARGDQPPARPGGRSRTIRRVAAAVAGGPAAVALAVPLFVLGGVTGAPAAAAATRTPSCTEGVGTAAQSRVPAAGGSKETQARRAAARWFPASQVAMATSVAGAESSWNPGAVNTAAGGNYGLWQINAVHSDLLRHRDWQDPEVNAWMAYQVWDAADGKKGDHRGSWTPWTVFTSGSYTAFLRGGKAAAERSSKKDKSGQETTAGCAGTGGPGIVLASWNALRTNSTANIAAGTRDLTKRADVFGLQELGNETKRAAAARGATGFTMSTDHTAVPILWRTAKYTLLEQGRELAFDEGQHVEHSGQDGSSSVGPKWVTWVHLEDKATGQAFYVLNTHMLVGAENSVRIRRAHVRRVALYDRQLATLTTLADKFRGQGATVYATCDCNVNYSPKVAPVRAMRAHGLVPSWQTLDSPATHGKRAIDYVWSTAAPASQTTGHHHGSDHAALVVSFLPSAPNVVASAAGTVTGTRTVTDPKSGETFQVPIPAGKAGKAINFALDQLGERFAWGGDGPAEWDCSGLTSAAWAQAGVTIPHQSKAQERTLRHVPLSQAQPGDIFWHPGFVQIYLGTIGGKRTVVEAGTSHHGVRITTSGWMHPEAVLRP